MKKAIINTRTIITVFITILILATQSAHAVEKTLPVENTQSASDFKFVGKFSNGPLFQLSLNNTEVDEFIVRVKDADNNLLYLERLKGANVSRKYQFAIESEDLYDVFSVKFEITSVKTNKTLVFNATSKNHTVNDIIIAKL